MLDAVIVCLLFASCSALGLESGKARMRGSSRSRSDLDLQEGEKVVVFREDGDLPDAMNDGIDAVKAWTRKRMKMGEDYFDKSGYKRMTSPEDWANSVVYHVQADRFNNGRIDNDLANIDLGQDWDLKVGDNSNIPIWRHGGDFKGILDRIPYMKDLGVDALWVTPILQHDGNYHAYCATDPSTTDPGFGSPQEFRDLVAECHKHGIYFVLDIVVNHLCDPETGYIERPEHVKCPKAMNESHWAGTNGTNEWQGALWFGKDFFPPFREQEFFTRCGECEYEEMSDEGPGSVFGDFRDGMFDYDTRNPNFQEIYTNLMKFWIGYADVDAYRLDAAKHVTEDFAAYFGTEMRDYARSLGKDNFMVIGEVATLQAEWQAARVGRMNSNPENPDEHDSYCPKTLTQRMWDLKDKYLANPKFPMPGLNAVYNFMISGTGRDVILGWRSGEELNDYLTGPKYSMVMAQLSDLKTKVHLPDAIGHSELWTALELHDWPRLLTDFPSRADLSSIEQTWLMTAPGTPVIYAGLEQGFNGNCPHFDTKNDTWNQGIGKYCANGYVNMRYDAPKRQDMFFGPWRLASAVPQINDLAYVGPINYTVGMHWKDDPFLARNHSLYQMSRKLVNLRRSCPCLSHGNMTMRYFSNETFHLMAYSRFMPPNSSSYKLGAEMVIVLNPKNETRLLRLPIDSEINKEPGEKYRNVFNLAEVAWVEIDKGKAYLKFGGPDDKGALIPPASQAIFMHEDHLRPYHDKLGIALCKSNHTPSVVD